MDNNSKVCLECGEAKPLSAFRKHKTNADGYVAWCKPCTVAHTDRVKAERKKAPFSTEYFISKARGVHGDKYDYTDVQCTKSIDRVSIRCKFHDSIFIQMANAHLSGTGCPKCGHLQSTINNTKTTEEFIKEAKQIHGDRYDYSKTEYTTSKEPITIICKVHGEFNAFSSSHISKKFGCAKCGVTQSQRTKARNMKNKFISQAIVKYGDKYDYSQVVYRKKILPVKIICPIHGVTEMSPDRHLAIGCEDCCRKEQLEGMGKVFLKKAQDKFGDKFDYSKVEYVNSTTPVKIICPIHGEFEYQPDKHLQTFGCPNCGNVIGRRHTRKTTEEFIKQCQDKFGDKFDYSKVEYKLCMDKVKIICPIHGEVYVHPLSFLRSNYGCPDCGRMSTIGENSKHWRGGTTTESDKRRRAPKYRKWRGTIVERFPDCDYCAKPFSKENPLFAHHLNSFTSHPNSRYDVENGVGLCRRCHEKFHNEYGYGGNTRIQYEDFKSNMRI